MQSSGNCLRHSGYSTVPREIRKGAACGFLDSSSTANSETTESDMAPIPDNVEGAFLISIIDFILSFVIISGIGVILAILPVVNRFWVIDDKDLKGGH